MNPCWLIVLQHGVMLLMCVPCMQPWSLASDRHRQLPAGAAASCRMSPAKLQDTLEPWRCSVVGSSQQRAQGWAGFLLQTARRNRAGMGLFAPHRVANAASRWHAQHGLGSQCLSRNRPLVHRVCPASPLCSDPGGAACSARPP